MNIDRPGYSGRIYDRAGLRKHAEFVKAELERLKGGFDFVAVTGKSGMAVAFAALAIGAEFDLVTVRKGEKAHGRDIEGRANGPRYIVLDDLIDTGATIRRIHEQLTHETRFQGAAPELVGVLLYSRDGSYRHGDVFPRFGDGLDFPAVPVFAPTESVYA